MANHIIVIDDEAFAWLKAQVFPPEAKSLLSWVIFEARRERAQAAVEDVIEDLVDNAQRAWDEPWYGPHETAEEYEARILRLPRRLARALEQDESGIRVIKDIDYD